MPDIHSTKLAVIGLGYVGLPLAVEFSKKMPCIGFDLKEQRIAELNQGLDVTQEVPSEELVHAEQLRFTSLLEELQECNVFIIAVPTPIDVSKRPDLRPLKGASHTVAQVLQPGDVVIYESTVYPGQQFSS
ncbi:MAG: hypothetical protein V8K32_09070 [Candidatus Electrothrix gigas]